MITSSSELVTLLLLSLAALGFELELALVSSKLSFNLKLFFKIKTAEETAKTKTVIKNKTDNLGVFCFLSCFLFFCSTTIDDSITASFSTFTSSSKVLSLLLSNSNLLLRAFLIGLEGIFVREIKFSFKGQKFYQVFTLKNLKFIK